MMLTKETLIHVGIITTLTGAVFAIILSSGATDFNELKIQAYAKAVFTDEFVLLSYEVYNTGDFEITKITVSTLCKPESWPLAGKIDVLNSIKDSKTLKCDGLVRGDEMVLQFDAEDALGNKDTDILTVPLD